MLPMLLCFFVAVVCHSTASYPQLPLRQSVHERVAQLPTIASSSVSARTCGTVTHSRLFVSQCSNVWHSYPQSHLRQSVHERVARLPTIACPSVSARTCGTVTHNRLSVSQCTIVSHSILHAINQPAWWSPWSSSHETACSKVDHSGSPQAAN